MKKIIIKNFFNTSILKIMRIDILFFVHTSLGIYLIYLASLELNFSYKVASYIWISIFIPLFFFKTRKDIRKENGIS